MDILNVIKIRRSIREFKVKPLAKDVLEKIIDAARFAPTARSVQPWEFVIVTQREVLKKIAALAENGPFISDAAACIAVFCAETKYYLEDGCAATENLMLEAAALGIGSCWVAGDKKPYCQAIKGILGAPDQFKLVSLIPLGYPKKEDEFKVKDKRSLKDLIHWEKFDNIRFSE